MAQATRSRRRRSVEAIPNTAEAPRPARGLIELPSVLPVSEVGGLQQLHLFGRATAGDVIQEVTIGHAGAVAARTRYPVAPADSRYGFAATLVRGPTGTDQPWRVSVTARRADDETERAEFVLTSGPEPGKASVQSGVAVAGLAVTDPLPPVIIHIDRASLGAARRLVVEGWVLALAPLEEIRILTGRRLLGSARIGLTRQDVAKWRPEFPNAAQSGFELTTEAALPAATTSIRVLITAGGLTHETTRLLDRVAPATPPRPPDPPRVPESPRAETDRLRHEIRLHCDLAELAPEGQLSVLGWAVSPTGITSVAVVLDGAPLGDAEFGLARHDVGDEYVTIPMARHAGFRYVGAVEGPADHGHEIRLVARNGLGDTRELTCPVRLAEPVPPTHADRAQFRIEIDSPPVIDGMVAEPVSGRLTIEGWAVCRAGIDRVGVFLDGQALGDAHFGIARQDVARVCPDWPQAARSGFAFHCPPRLLRNGPHSAELRFKALNGEILTRSFRFEINRPDDTEEEGPRIRRRIARVEADAYATTLSRARARTRFRLILRLAAANDRDALAATLRSLSNQVYDDWRLLVLVDETLDRSNVRAVLASVAPELLNRMDIIDSTRTTWPGSEELAERGLMCVLSPGDELGADALAEIAVARAEVPNADVIYADEIRISPTSEEREPFFKPAFSPDLLRSTNYIGRPWFVTLALLRRAGISPSDLSRTSEYNAVLRCTELARTVAHVPKLLCRRGPMVLDSPSAEQRALVEAASRLSVAAEVTQGRVAGTWRLRRNDHARTKISVIVPTCASGGHIETCIRSLRAHADGHEIEIICVENIPPMQEHWRAWLRRNADRVIRIEEAFNWSRFNNLAAAVTDSEYLLFLNDDIEIEQPGWLDAMLDPLASPDVAVVGARLLYPDRSVQHGGMFLGEFGVGRHAFRFAGEDEPGYFGLALTARNVIAVTGACMMIRRSHFDELGGFDESHAVVNNDLDFCLRTHAAGRRIVYTPHASLIHHELASRTTVPETFDRVVFASRWRSRFAKGDPFHNPNLSRAHDDIRPNDEPVHLTWSGHPLFAAEEIRRILVVKVDHIGDFITALPAIRQLKSHFPAAALHVLASPSVRGCLALEPAINELIPFEFFHARSALGQKELTAQELDELRERLRPYRFDLAIDMRKHPETRMLLRATGARYSAGFDYAGQFPWLDVTLEWERDRGLQAKRRHIIDDLLHLVEAVATSAKTQRDVLSPDVLNRLRDEPLPVAVPGLFDRPVVCVHPGAGNEMKQWPTDHFVALIDLLAQECNVNVLLIGGPDETEIARQILGDVHEQQALHSVVGQVPLSDLARLFVRCALFVGNDSGPKHLAAAVGIPTIGIHSGSVDPTEWAPIGASAVAVARKMTCSPCYLNHIADCPRELACIRQLDPGAVFRLCRRFLMEQAAEG